MYADEFDEDDGAEEVRSSEVKDLSEEERECLRSFIKTLDVNKDKDPKYVLVLELLQNKGFAEKGCIIFSQYFDSAYWVAGNLSNDMKGVTIGVYAGGDKSGIIRDGKFQKRSKEDVKAMVRRRAIKILLGTDAASEVLTCRPWGP